MPKGTMYVETMPASPDREADYHRWYDDTHLAEITSVDGIVAARRFAPVDGNGPFVAIYERDCDDLDAMGVSLRFDGSPPASSRPRPPLGWKRRCIRPRPASSQQCRRRSPTRDHMADFTICIPRVSIAVSEAKLTELLIDEGHQVAEGAPLFVIATEKVDQEIEAGASGTEHWTGEIGTTYDIGTEIGVIETP